MNVSGHRVAPQMLYYAHKQTWLWYRRQGSINFIAATIYTVARNTNKGDMKVEAINIVSLRQLDIKTNDSKQHEFIGYMTIQIGCLMIRDCKVLWDREQKRYWAAMPSGSYTSSDGIKQYYPIVQIAKEDMAEFNTKIREQIEAWMELSDKHKSDDDLPF